MADEHELALDRERPEPRERPPASHRDAGGHAWEVAKRAVAHGTARGAQPSAMLHLQRMAGNAGIGALVQRDEDGDDAATSRSPVLDVVGKGGGSPLPAPVRAEMEAGLGADFGSVRIHDGPSAASSAQAVQASAYTVGDEIVFNRGAYQPDTPGGRHTLAHELTHVVQQRSGPVDGTATGDGVMVSHPDDRFERAAEASAAAFSAGGSSRDSASALQRRGDGDGEEAGVVQRLPVQREDVEDEALEDEPVQTYPLQRQEAEEMPDDEEPAPA